MAEHEKQALRQRIAAALEKREVLLPALATFATELPPGNSRRQLRKLTARLAAGASVDDFCTAVDRSTLWLLLLGQNTPRWLSHLSAEAEGEHHSLQRRQRVFLYPLFIFLMSLAVLLFSCLLIIPMFKSIYDDFGMTLPTLTQWLLNVSHSVNQSPLAWLLWMLVALSGAGACLRGLQLYGLPGRLGSRLTAGNARQLMRMARFSRQLAEALEAGLKLPAALRIAGQAISQRTPRRIMLQLADDLERNTPHWSEPSDWLPASVIHALQAYPGQAPNIPLLRQLADLYTTQVHDRYGWSNSYLAHFSIAGVGVIVGFVFLGLYLPLINLLYGII